MFPVFVGPFFMSKFVELKNHVELFKNCTPENSIEQVATPTNSDPL